MKKNSKIIGLTIVLLFIMMTKGFSNYSEPVSFEDSDFEKPIGSAISYISSSNNLTYETLVSGRMKGVAEVGQYIVINATFSQNIDEAWFQENFTTPTPTILVNHSLTPQEFFGNKVSYIYFCSGLIADVNRGYRIAVKNGTSYSFSPVSLLWVKSAASPDKVLNLAVQNSGTGAISFTWTPGVDNVNVTHYRIYRRINSAMDAGNCESYFYAYSTHPFYQDFNILESNTYYYSVKSVDGINRNSSFTEPVFLKPDLTPPNIISTVKFSVVIGASINITITTQADCVSVSLIISTADNLLEYDPVSLEKIETTASTTIWMYEIDTNNFFGMTMLKGSYTLRFTLTDGFENNNESPYEYEGGLVVNAPGLDPLIIVLIIIGVGAVTGIIVFIKLRNKRTSDNKGSKYEEVETRKREIYYGASKIGKMSGEAADAQMAARGRDSVTNRSVLREKQIESVSSKIESDSLSNTSRKQLPSAIQMKLEEQKVSTDKKMQFLDSKVDSLISQLDILSSIISMKKEDILCPNCEHVMGLEWEVCPFCKIKDKDDELSLKKSTISLESKKKQCSKCGMSLEPSWVICPKCYINSHQNK